MDASSVCCCPSSLDEVLHAGGNPGDQHAAILAQTVTGQRLNRLQTQLANVRSEPVTILC